MLFDLYFWVMLTIVLYKLFKEDRENYVLEIQVKYSSYHEYTFFFFFLCESYYFNSLNKWGMKLMLPLSWTIIRRTNILIGYILKKS